MSDIVICQSTFLFLDSFDEVIHSLLGGNQILGHFVELLPGEITPGQLLEQKPVIVQVEKLFSGSESVKLIAMTVIWTIKLLHQRGLHRVIEISLTGGQALKLSWLV